jgi:ATP-dependent 26S proteasome regulatory subunit
MDGFVKNDKVIVVAASNNLSCVDAALLRPGRFDSVIEISQPNEDERVGIFKTLVKRKQINCVLMEKEI